MTLRDYFIDHMSLGKEWSFDRNPEKLEHLKTHSKEKVWWRCEKGHEWQARVDSRVYLNRGCPYCANQSIMPGENDLAVIKPEKAVLWHPTRNGGLKPSDIAPGSKQRVWWKCERGHEWQARADTQINQSKGCPCCAGRLPVLGETDLATTHPKLLALWSDQNVLTPGEVTAGSHKKVWWRCEKGHEWKAMVNAVTLQNCGCPYCEGKRAIPGENDLGTVRPELLEQWDWEKNTGVSPRYLLPSAHDKVWWRCGLGHSYQMQVYARTREKGSGCPYCAGRRVLAGFNDLATLKPELAEQWYAPLNGDLRPEDVTLGSNKKVWWQCREGHVWQAAIYSRTRRRASGCPVCAGTVKPLPNMVSMRKAVHTGVTVSPASL